MCQQSALVWISMVNTPALPSSPGLQAKRFTSWHCQTILRLLWSPLNYRVYSMGDDELGYEGWCWLLAHDTAALTSDSAPHTRSGPCRTSGWGGTWKRPSCCSWHCKIWPSLVWWPAVPIHACTLWAWVVCGRFVHMAVVQPDRVVQPGNVACWYWGWTEAGVLVVVVGDVVGQDTARGAAVGPVTEQWVIYQDIKHHF
jgi:hypothetical protein